MVCIDSNPFCKLKTTYNYSCQVFFPLNVSKAPCALLEYCQIKGQVHVCDHALSVISPSVVVNFSHFRLH